MSSSDQVIAPGSFPGGVPTPTEIECIEVMKVYDLCFQQETRTRTFTTTDHTEIACFCGTTTPVSVCSTGTAIPCRIGPADCTELNRQQTSDGFASIQLLVNVPIFLFPVGTTNTTTAEPCVSHTVRFTKQVVLCAPEGTDVVCRVTGLCDCMIIDEGFVDGRVTSLTIECALTFCVVVKAVADVNLLVPSYGFCVPAECVTMGLGVCPPTPPAQCTTTAGTGSGDTWGVD